ncbi:acyl-CoA/acyl-ACP dehydrogenase [Phycicoccus sp. HDW14]|uniref:acyl-CoA/acyl-ACP dehydrogenase n=1 Tax=Phycicoccus sp. HDW14 TaxID=2714941 RepID=UPI00140AADBD|nr:acyl-CoA/acyl-ACP dehydrogenase [Phycicoccus sp. HDW14]QIM21882.1 acyl-CoA/acyl-ACP dehydrogenase [Phycicoccus sp. HDW14]
MGTVWRADEWAEDVGVVDGTSPHRALDAARALAGVARALPDDPWTYLATLASLGATDLTAARALEPHLDAVAVLAQAGDPDLSALGVDDDSTFGVYAARAPGTGLEARPGPDGPDLVSGTKAWCSLAGLVSHAVVTTTTGEDERLHVVPLRHPGVTHAASTWVSRGLAAVTTGSLQLDDVPGIPLGGPGWYLGRPGFAWGGIGVAAVWFGGAAALAGALLAAAGRRPPDQVARLHLGTVDRVLHASLLSLRHAADEIRGGRADGPAGSLLAARTRAVVADAAEVVLTAVGHGLGPAPLTHDEPHARRVADLTVYLRQHHAERDLVALGDLVLGARGSG